MSARDAIEAEARTQGWDFIVRMNRRLLLSKPVTRVPVTAQSPEQRISVWFTKSGKIKSASFTVQNRSTVVAWSHHELPVGHRRRQILDLLTAGVPRLPQIRAVELERAVWANALFDPAAVAEDYQAGQRVALHPSSGIVRNTGISYGYVQGTIDHYGTPLVQVLLAGSGKITTMVPWLLGDIVGPAVQGS